MRGVSLFYKIQKDLFHYIVILENSCNLYALYPTIMQMHAYEGDKYHKQTEYGLFVMMHTEIQTVNGKS